MATAADLIRTISTATGLPLATVTDLDRRLVKANLRPIGGRGPNAARMGPLEAARLLTATLASPQSNEAAESVSRYAQTRPDGARSNKALFVCTKLEDLAYLTNKHSFVEGLRALILSAGNGSLAKLMSGTTSKQFPQIEVYAFTQAILGRIRISGLPNGLTANVEYVPALSTASRSRSYNNILGDLEQSRRITERTIFSVAKLLV